LHHVLQIMMGWEDSHLHEFRVGRRVYSVPHPDNRMYEREVIDDAARGCAMLSTGWGPLRLCLRFRRRLVS
jgi:hypothetical protein